MTVKFSKYQGTGNDFVMIDNLNGEYNSLSLEQIRFLCDRKMGIGADGLIKISPIENYDFEVEYYNADGSQSFCGNGARCSVAFAKSLGLIEDTETIFWAIDGRHEAAIYGAEDVHLEMKAFPSIEKDGEAYIIDTGSPHYVKTLDKDEELDIVEFGKSIRYSDQFKEVGINVNTMKVVGEGQIEVQTYERGVEDETLSCGTGVTACALALMIEMPSLKVVDITTKGGLLKVESELLENGFKSVWLSGPAKHVFNGSIDC